ncbi:hypothetical protein O6H91_10G055500 [Diphasiastrum complanatum]|uniref:Uncharacterized protein n=1 Tax=Diphasiastrum complanatum TaxID=34168 RepID=A0ACC2CH39_DIPCM|nr:hypothetical protein O6H91_Y308700 [Diphasiastrum complanatum]KAJ7541346.1 hypothetical protein O6H91_10G055500 [Diphasiastrum complanatum]
MEKLLAIKEKEIVFDFKLGCKCRSVVHLKNLSATAAVAFKVETTAPEKFFVTPPYGRMPASSQLSLIFTLRPQSSFPEQFPVSDDQFLIKSVRVNSETDKKAEKPPSEGSSFTAVDTGKAVMDSKLNVFYVGEVLLRYLVAKGAVEDVKRMLRRHNSCNQCDDNGRTPLHLAAASRVGNLEMVDLLLKAGAKVDHVTSTTRLTPLLVAVLAGNDKVVRLLLKHGSDVEYKNANGSSAMHQAATWSHIGVLRSLIKRGASLEIKDNEGRTPLHCAVTEGHVDCVRELLKAGADKNARSSDGRTALFRAASKGYVDIVEMLLDYGADPQIRNSSGQSAHDAALQKEHVAVIDALESKDYFMTAARQGNSKLICEYLNKGVRVDTADQFGWTPLHYAAFKGHVEVVKELLEHGANIESGDEEGHTPLHCAAEAGKEKVVQLLLKVGAKADAKTKRGVTPLHLSQALQCRAVVSVLSEALKSSPDKMITTHKPTSDTQLRPTEIPPHCTQKKDMRHELFMKTIWQQIQT